MIKALSRDRVNGFLHAEGKRMLNGAGEEVLLAGWGLGNYLLCEGYMWLAKGDVDRPRRFEQFISDVAGSEYAEYFWRKFRDQYIAEEDIRRMAELGYNSVRIPFNYRLFMEDGPGLQWKDEGFLLLDRLIDWCEKYRIYAFLDMHGAPGGQTGSNIDDSVDNQPHLFLEQENFDKGIALWVKIAERYQDRWIVGGYDLLNEPLRTPLGEAFPDDMRIYEDRLRAFYREVIAKIRALGDRHLFTIEGYHWASDASIFDEKYDDNMCIHFHRYGCTPDISAYQEWLDVSEKLNAPLWLGETGENAAEWYAALYPLALELGIGINIWPWKKMLTTNTIYCIRKPKGWDELTDYMDGGKKPDEKRAQEILDSYLENMKLENCLFFENVHASLFKLPGTTLHGTDFDEFPGKGVSYGTARTVANETAYRVNTGMEIVDKYTEVPLGEGFGYPWRKYVLGMETGDFACYTIHDTGDGVSVRVTGFADPGTKIRAYINGNLVASYLQQFPLPADRTERKLQDADILVEFKLDFEDEVKLKLEIECGRVEIDSVITAPGAGCC